MRTAKEILQASRARIADPAHWTQHAYARDAAGKQVGYISNIAVCWCAHGSLLAESWKEVTIRNLRADLEASEALNEVARTLFDNASLAMVNDNIGHAAVLRIYDLAIQEAA